MAGIRAKATRRSGEKRAAIAARQAHGDFAGAFHDARGWLAAEMRKVERQRPRDAEAIYLELTASLCSLAEALPTYLPTTTPRKGG
jgi:hypothetical protein